jgi:hypothetical protein
MPQAVVEVMNFEAGLILDFKSAPLMVQVELEDVQFLANLPKGRRYPLAAAGAECQ